MATQMQPGKSTQVVKNSAAFQSGYDAGYENVEATGWHIDQTPEESTLVETIRIMSHILVSDGLDDYEVRWCAGLLAGWFQRGINA